MELTQLSQFGLGEKDVRVIGRNVLVQKWNWEYTLCHSFQRFCLDYVGAHPEKRILISCNHPHLFTNGRGLQKPRKGETLQLKEFDPAMCPSLPFPFHQIERGGGLTFHHPGQFVFYPIVRLHPDTLSLSKLMDDMLVSATEVLSHWGLKNVSHQNKFLGLWLGPRKLASVGIAIEKLTTFHGMALNIFRDEKMDAAVKSVNPCGLHAETYGTVDDFIHVAPNAIEKFAYEFTERIMNNWD